MRHAEWVFVVLQSIRLLLVTMSRSYLKRQTLSWPLRLRVSQTLSAEAGSSLSFYPIRLWTVDLCKQLRFPFLLPLLIALQAISTPDMDRR